MSTTCDIPTHPSIAMRSMDLANRPAPTRPAPRAAAGQLPIRRHAGVEVPAAGLWPLQTSSYVVRSNKRGEREQLHIKGGWFDLDDDPTKCWLHVEFEGRAFDMTVLGIVDDATGMSAWHLTGVADSGNRQAPMTMSLRYHGVFRRGEQMWAWYSGTAVIDGGRRTGERLHMDLSFEAA